MIRGRCKKANASRWRQHKRENTSNQTGTNKGDQSISWNFTEISVTSRFSVCRRTLLACQRSLTLTTDKAEIGGVCVLID